MTPTCESSESTRWIKVHGTENHSKQPGGFQVKDANQWVCSWRWLQQVCLISNPPLKKTREVSLRYAGLGEANGSHLVGNAFPGTGRSFVITAILLSGAASSSVPQMTRLLLKKTGGFEPSFSVFHSVWCSSFTNLVFRQLCCECLPA